MAHFVANRCHTPYTAVEAWKKYDLAALDKE
jgi:hypothetical protein